MGKSGPISDASLKDKTIKVLSGNDLCALCLLFGHPPVFLRAGSGEKID
jgi:hypothetical protein